MKFILFIIGIVLFPMAVSAQNNIIIQQSSSNYRPQSQSYDNAFYIQGISSAENIGGVDVTTKRNPDPYGNPYLRIVYFKNYRKFPVTVLFQFTIGHPDSSRDPELVEGSITLGAEETKEFDRMVNSPRNFKLIVRSL